MKKILISLILLSLIIPLHAQLFFETFANQNEIQALAEEGNYIWIGTSGGVIKRQKSTGALIASYNMTDGLANNDVFGIAIDEAGNKWIATYNGVSKFDGTNWTTYRAADGLASVYSNNVLIDLDGNVWVGSSNGVSKFDGSSWTAYYITGNGVMDLALDDNGFVWVGTWGDGIFVFPREGDPINYTTANSGLTEDIILSIAVDRDGMIWIGQWLDYIAVFDGDASWTYHDNTNGCFCSSPEDIVVDVLNNKWIAHANGVYKYDNLSSSWHNYNSSDGLIYNYTTVITVDDQGNKWVGTQFGLSRYNDDVWSSFTVSSGLPSNDVRDVAHLADRSTWFATGNGLVKFKNGIMTTYNTGNSGLVGNSVFSLCTKEPGVIWIGTSNGVSRFNGTTWESYTNASTGGGLYSGIIEAIEIDHSGNIWFGTYNGTSVFNGVSTWTNYAVTKVTDFYCAVNGDMWITTNGNGTYKYSGGFTNYTTSNGLVANYCRSVSQDHDGVIWIGHNAHLTKYDGAFHKIYLWSQGFGSDAIEGIVVDSLNNIWFSGSYHGILKYDGINWVRYDADDGLANSWTNNINVDYDHNIWVSTDGGVTKISCQNPVPDFESTIACWPGFTGITNTSANTDATTKFEWVIGANGSVEYTSEDISHQFPSHGTYNVKLSAINDHCAESITRQVIVNSMPQASIVPSGSTTICNGTTVTLMANIDNYDAGLNYTYSWNTGAATSSIAPGVAGSYGLTVSHEDCSHTPSNVAVGVVEPYNNAEICMVSVDDETYKNMIIWEKTPSEGIAAYNIYKLFGSSYTIVGQVPYDDLSVFVDHSSSPDAVAARYAISVIDTCGNESDLSPYHQTIHLGASEGALPNQIELDWTEYIDENGGFTYPYFYIFRGASVGTLALYDSVSSAFTAFTDLDAQGNIYYRIGVKSPSLCVPTGNLKAGSGPYSHSMSNVEDNRLQTAANEPPTDITIDDNTIDEEVPVSSLVGRFTTSDPNAEDQHTYTLVSGTGSTDNGSFIIVSDLLLSAKEFDYETKSSYSIRIRTTDNGTDNLYYEKAFTITINNISENGSNLAPTNILIDNSSINENSIAGTMIGRFSSTDPNPGDSHTYALVSGTGDTDNSSFAIAGNLLISAEIFDYETKTSYSIRVRSTDDGTGNLNFEKALTITINDITETPANQAPTDISLDNLSIDENKSAGSLIGRISSVDPNATDQHTYRLIAGEGDTDNGSFTILGDLLLSATSFDFETRDELSIRIKTTDNGSGNMTFEKVFTITVIDQIDVQVENPEAEKFLIYPNPFRDMTILEFPNPDEKEFRLTVMDLTGKVVRLAENITTGRFELKREDLPAGYYFIELRGSKVYRGRVIIE